jgi:hypothetical protein
MYISLLYGDNACFVREIQVVKALRNTLHAETFLSYGGFLQLTNDCADTARIMFRFIRLNLFYSARLGNPSFSCTFAFLKKQLWSGKKIRTGNRL